MSGFDVNSFCDNFDDGYGIFDDVADSLDFAAVGISTATPEEAVIRPIQPIVPTTPTRPQPEISCSDIVSTGRN